MPDSPSDAELVRAAQKGDRDALGTLLDRYRNMVFELTTQYAHVSSDAEDLAQDVFLRAFERLDQLNQSDRFAAWLYSMALNRCRDYAKNRRRETHAFTDTKATTHQLAGASEDRGDESLMWSEEMDHVWEAIRALPPTYAVPFLLKYRDGLPYKAMATRMDVSVSALKVRVHRARKKLQAYLESTYDK